MKALTFMLLSLVFSFAHAKDFVYPQYKKSVKSISESIPIGWSILDSASGDLNTDRYDDVVLVLQLKDTVEIVEKSEIEGDTVSTQPRVLLIMMYNSTTLAYDLVQYSETFILQHDNPNMDDPFEDVSIRNSILQLEFRIFMHSGSWTSSHHIYRFIYKDGEFVLSEAVNLSVHRASGETVKQNFNFSTGKVKIVKGNNSNNREKVEWRKIKTKVRKKLRTFVQPFTWEVGAGLYL